MPSHRPRARRAFTLIEALVAVSVIALLVGILLPALGAARRAATTVACLSNVRSIEIAQHLYANDFKGALVDAGLPHGGKGNEPGAFIHTLQPYVETPLLYRSPADRSPHWPPGEHPDAGVPVEETDDLFRRTSYGLNNFLTSYAPGRAWRRIDRVPRPATTVHVLMMTESGEYAASDHPHVETWWVPGIDPAYVPRLAAQHVQIDQHGGPALSFDSRANYGFLDGHAETLAFGAVFTDFQINRFDPDRAD